MQINSRNAPKFVVRFPTLRLKEDLQDRADIEHRAMNSVVIVALERYVRGQTEFDLLLKTLREKIAEVDVLKSLLQEQVQDETR